MQPVHTQHTLYMLVDHIRDADSGSHFHEVCEETFVECANATLVVHVPHFSKHRLRLVFDLA